MFTLSYAMAIYFIFNNIALTFIGKNIKYLVFFMISLMWILFWGSTNNADSSNYLLLYENVSETGMGWINSEVGFVGLIRIAVFFGLEYSQFLMVISFISLSLIYITVQRYTQKLKYVWSLYFIYPFLLDVVQVRHFLAMSIMVYSINFLLKGKNVRYTIGILIAFSIQFATVMFLPFIFIYKMKIKNIWIITIASIILGIFLVKSNYILYLIGFIVSIDKINMYFENKASFGFLLQWIIQIMFMLPIYIIYVKVQSERFVELVYKLNIYLLMMFPIYMINLNSSRIFRMILILNYIVYAIGFLKLNGKIRYALFIYVMFLVVGEFGLDILFSTSDIVLYPIFQKNIILN